MLILLKRDYQPTLSGQLVAVFFSGRILQRDPVELKY